MHCLMNTVTVLLELLTVLLEYLDLVCNFFKERGEGEALHPVHLPPPPRSATVATTRAMQSM